VVGTSVFDHVMPEYRQTVQDAFDPALTAGETVTYELIGSRLGVPIPVECRVAPLARDGRTVGVTIVSSDITERKRAEEERRRLEGVALRRPRCAEGRVSQGPSFRGGGTILVADDEEGVREVAREMLERQSIRVIAVEVSTSRFPSGN
jgi:hypothetical protein